MLLRCTDGAQNLRAKTTFRGDHLCPTTPFPPGFKSILADPITNNKYKIKTIYLIKVTSTGPNALLFFHQQETAVH